MNKNPTSGRMRKGKEGRRCHRTKVRGRSSATSVAPVGLWADPPRQQGAQGLRLPQRDERVRLPGLDAAQGPSVRTSSPVIVIDRATYHTTLTEEIKPAKSTFCKIQLAEWLVAHGLVDGDKKTVGEYMTLTKTVLRQLCKQSKPTSEYEVSVSAREFNCGVLLLPVGHPELNPIELVWGHVKRFV